MNAGWIAKAVVFALASLGALHRSWASLRDPRSYGFYRFFGFETVFLLLLRNAGDWFVRPLGGGQIVSWALLLGSAAMAASGFLALGRYGAPQGTIDRTSRVVTRGIYRWIRHPLYGSLILLAWGAALKRPDLLSTALALLATACFIATAVTEESETRRRLGAPYEEYMRRTRRFLPGLF
jgi:protein-S-isoprenylcysteine O-methyltransferase Ste14